MSAKNIKMVYFTMKRAILMTSFRIKQLNFVFKTGDITILKVLRRLQLIELSFCLWLFKKFKFHYSLGSKHICDTDDIKHIKGIDSTKTLPIKTRIESRTRNIW